ncbi:hypothetical protein E3T49_11925, partial [Cryobacterium cryoconiti]
AGVPATGGAGGPAGGTGGTAASAGGAGGPAGGSGGAGGPAASAGGVTAGCRFVASRSLFVASRPESGSPPNFELSINPPVSALTLSAGKYLRTWSRRGDAVVAGGIRHDSPDSARTL